MAPRAAFTFDVVVNGISVPLKAYSVIKPLPSIRRSTRAGTHPVRRAEVDGETGEVLAPEDITKVYVDGDDEFPMSDAEVADLVSGGAQSRTLGWLPEGAEHAYISKGPRFYLAPKDAAAERPATGLWMHMERGRVLLVEVTTRGKQTLLAIEVAGPVLLAREVAYAQEVADMPESADFELLWSKNPDLSGKNFAQDKTPEVEFDGAPVRSGLPKRIDAWLHRQRIRRAAEKGLD